MAKRTDSASTTEKPVKETKPVEKKTKKLPAKTKKADAAPVAETSEENPQPADDKKQIIEQFQVADGDTGSPEVQVALLTKRIEKLVSHLKTNHSDNHSRRGLLGIVSKRRRLLNYLEKKDKKRYKEVIDKLGMSK